MLWSFCKHFRIYSSLCEEPICIEEEHSKEHRNEASHDVFSRKLDSHNKQRNADGKDKVKKKLLIAESPDEKACATDERVDPFKLWPEVAGKQHP